MILVDVNLLIYAHVSSQLQHEAAREWLDGRLNGTTPVGLPWASLLGFVRLISNPRIYAEPEAVEDAWRQVEEWLSCPVVWIPSAGERHAEILGGLIRKNVRRADLVPDAHLAALALEHGLILCSTDGDFAQFDGLRWENPL